MGHKYKYGTAEEVFMDIAKSINAFSGLDYEVIGDLGAKLKLNSVSKPAIA
jgi:predicted molibdopterin-dependent oxidoreductase YjgC